MTSQFKWANYLVSIAGRDTGAEISLKTGTAASTVSRWLSGSNSPQPAQVIAVARAYGEHPLQALVESGYLTNEEIDTAPERPRTLQLADFSDLEIAHESLRRASARATN